MNITITGNPYVDEGTVVASRGVMTDAKIAKLNNATKRPSIIANWEKGRPSEFSATSVASPTPVDYDGLLVKLGASAVNYAPNSNNTGAKKLRVNKIVNEKASKIYGLVTKVDVIPREEMKPIVEAKPKLEEKTAISMEPVITSTRGDIHGRHEKTGEIPVDAIREAVKNDTPPISMPSSMPSRAERNSLANEMSYGETKAGDMDLYNDLLHSSSNQGDVSKQLQGARKELSLQKEESKKLAEKYGEAVKELEELKADIENAKKEKDQKIKQELNATLNDIETIKKENLERTSDLSSIQAEIARLRAQRNAMEDNFYDDYRSYGRGA